MQKLYYVHDPMCSWCWGFNQTWSTVELAVRDKIDIEYIVGGLAPDSDQAMPKELQTTLHNTWKTIQQRIPGTEFNFDFWSVCKPRRSTYPACRAVVAATRQNAEKEMILAIQHAYYLNAKNPSDNDTLVSLSRDIGLDTEVFAQDLESSETEKQLMQQIEFGQSIGVQGFPSLILQAGEQRKLIRIDYNSADNIVEQLGL